MELLFVRFAYQFHLKCLKVHTHTHICTLYTSTHVHVYIVLIDFNCARSSALGLWGGLVWAAGLDYFRSIFRHKMPDLSGQRMHVLSDFAHEKYSLGSCLLNKCLGSVLMIYE